MENKYNDLMQTLINEILSDNLDCDVYNIEALTNKITNKYIKKRTLEAFFENVMEDIGDILYDEYKIELGF